MDEYIDKKKIFAMIIKIKIAEIKIFEVTIENPQ